MKLPDRIQRHVMTVEVGGLSRDELMLQLSANGIGLNGHAETLLADAAFDEIGPEIVSIVVCSVRDLGYPEGASLSQIYARAEARGLLLCPPTTGPYMRLTLINQTSFPDSVLNSGRAPSGSVTVAARALRDDDEFPTGFYLRVINNQSWLRGYTCGDEHTWSPENQFAFTSPMASAS